MGECCGIVNALTPSILICETVLEQRTNERTKEKQREKNKQNGKSRNVKKFIFCNY